MRNSNITETPHPRIGSATRVSGFHIGLAPAFSASARARPFSINDVYGKLR